MRDLTAVLADEDAVILVKRDWSGWRNRKGKVREKSHRRLGSKDQRE